MVAFKQKYKFVIMGYILRYGRRIVNQKEIISKHSFSKDAQDIDCQEGWNMERKNNKNQNQNKKNNDKNQNKNTNKNNNKNEYEK